MRRAHAESNYSPQVAAEFMVDTSPLVQMLEQGHHNVRLDAEAWDRLYTWIDLGAPDHGSWRFSEWGVPANYYERRLEMLRQYHETHAGERVRAIASDLRMEAEIGGHRFVAVADRVDEELDGALTLVRYKTTRRLPGPGELAQDLSAKLLWRVGEQHFGRPVRVAVEALRPGKVIVADFPPGAGTETERSLVSQAQEIRGVTDYPTRKGKHCRHCRSRARCSAWERRA